MRAEFRSETRDAPAAWSLWSPVFAAWVAAALRLRDGERVPVSTAHLKRFVDGGLSVGARFCDHAWRLTDAY